MGRPMTHAVQGLRARTHETKIGPRPGQQGWGRYLSFQDWNLDQDQNPERICYSSRLPAKELFQWYDFFQRLERPQMEIFG